MVQGMWVAHGAEVKDGGIAIRSFDPLHFLGYGFQRFVPGNPGEFASTPGSGPLKRVEKPVGGIDTLTVGMASGTHAGAPFPIIGLNPHNLVSPNVHIHFAVATAVAITDGTNYLFF